MQPTMDPLHLTIALGPVAAYLLLLGLLNVQRRPFVTSGARDLAALGVAVSGFMVAGPMQLLMPQQAAALLGGWVWLFLLSLYGLAWTLLILISRPRIVIYNVKPDALRRELAALVKQLDDEARWAGDTVYLPNVQVQLTVEAFPGMRNVQLLSAGAGQNFLGWWRLERHLAAALRSIRTSPNPYGFSLLFFGLFITAVLGYWLAAESRAVVDAFWELLRR